MQDDVGELRPVLAIVVDHQGDMRIILNILYPLEALDRYPFRLGIRGRIQRLLCQNVTDGQYQRAPGAVYRRQSGDAMGLYKPLHSWRPVDHVRPLCLLLTMISATNRV